MTAVSGFRGQKTLNGVLSGIEVPVLIPEIEISGIALDSRKVRPGNVFFALSGRNCHGMSFAKQAIDQGAVAVLFDPKNGGRRLAYKVMSSENTVLAINELDQKISLIADRFFDKPSSRLTVIGITGTDGKTSCSHFLCQSWKECGKSAVIGTLGWGSLNDLNPTQHTTPNAIELQKILAALCHQGVQFVAMEVSSHAQVQGRVSGVNFSGAVFTNIRRDHLDYHGTIRAYREAKLRILKTENLRFAVVNMDDVSAQIILDAAPSSVDIVGFSRNLDASSVRNSSAVRIVVGSGVKYRESGLSLQVECEHQREHLDVSVIGDFNVDNLLATIACLLAMGHSLKRSVRMVSHVTGVPGRLEKIDSGSSYPTVVIDYAHTPHALEKVLLSVRHHCSGKIWVVFGCGGNRDSGKRSQMGRLAESLADYVILTDDNPRNENGETIVQDILQGCERRDIMVIRDRKAAVNSAIRQAGSADLVLVAGKGHETTQEIAGIKYPLSDRSVARDALMNRLAGRAIS